MKKQPTIRKQPAIRESWEWNAEHLYQWQLEEMNRQLNVWLPSNRFYREKLGVPNLQLKTLDDLSLLPYTTKQELVDSANQSQDGLSTHHSFEASAYSRLHRTSGTTGNPLRILDTEQDWSHFWSGTWQHVLEAAEVSDLDRVFLAFSFGPFVGFWSAHQACVDRGATVIPGGGLSSLARLEFMRQTESTVLCCTPSYGLHLAEVAAAEKFPLQQLAIEKIIVAGESGGSVPAVRQRLEQEWSARVVDHSGATEVGPWGFGWLDGPGLHVIETSFIAEIIPIDVDNRGQKVSPSTSQPSESGESGEFGELVLTSLGRIGAPVLRYRTGDVVRALRPESGRCRFLWLPDGVRGRADNMVVIRGVNIFPSSIDAIVREFDEVLEYRVTVTRRGALDQLELDIETHESGREVLANRLAERLAARIGLRVPVRCVETQSLPRSELKSRRWHDLRDADSN